MPYSFANFDFTSPAPIRARSGGHGRKPIGRSEQIGEGLEEHAGKRQVPLQQHDGSPGIDHGFSIVALVVVGGGGKGHQQAGLAGGSQLSHRGCAAAGHDQIGPGKAGRHVVEEGAHLPALGVGSAGGIIRLGLRGVAHSALVQDGEPRNRIEQFDNPYSRTPELRKLIEGRGL